MPSNRSNSERGKAFDIDTKIGYMNKLYEVRESNSCCDCSLATICSSSVPDGKTQRRERRAKAIIRRKGRL